MSTTNHLDAVAYGIVRSAAEIREALRALAAGEPHPMVIPGLGMLRISRHQARALLHAAMPAKLAPSPRRRSQHARTLASLMHACRAMVALNDTHTTRATEAAIAASIDLRHQLQAWMRQARWVEATTRAGVAWPPAASSITTVMPPASTSMAEHHANAPSWEAGQARHPGAALELARAAGRRLAAAPWQLTLPLPAPAAPAVPGQLRLALAA